MMVHLSSIIGGILALIGLLAVLALVFARIAEKKGNTVKVPRVIPIIIVALVIVLIVLIPVTEFLENHATVIDVEYTSEHSIVQTETLRIREEKALTIIEDNGEVIGIYPTRLVKNMFEVDESGRITPDVGSVNLTVRGNKPTRAVNIAGVWLITNSSAEWVTRVILD